MPNRQTNAIPPWKWLPASQNRGSSWRLAGNAIAGTIEISCRDNTAASREFKELFPPLTVITRTGR